VRGVGIALTAGITSLALAAAATGATLEPIGSATYDRPTYVTSDPTNPDRLFITEQPGTIRVTTPAGTEPFLDLTDLVLDGGERGLWSIAFPPDFSQSRRFYVAYSATNPTGALTLDEFREEATPAATKGTRRNVLSIANNTSTANHNGGQLQFGPDGYLYWSTGEDANQSNSQTLSNLLGKILRIDPRGAAPGEYSIPADNPFTAPGSNREIWMLGLRNPWRFSFDRATGTMYVGDVGAVSVEEVDVGARGANYGWPICEGVCSSPHPELTNPIYSYAHNDPPCNAITGGYIVRDPDLGSLTGRYLFTDLCGGDLRSIDPAAPPPFDTWRREGLSVGTAVSFGEDACGRLYVVAQGDGRVYRIEGPSGGACVSGPPDTTPPQTKIRLKKRAGGTRVIAKLRSTEPKSTFECKLDRAKWKRCAKKRKLKGLDDGRHKFRARATDAAGNTDRSPARKRFKTRG